MMGTPRVPRWTSRVWGDNVWRAFHPASSILPAMKTMKTGTAGKIERLGTLLTLFFVASCSDATMPERDLSRQTGSSVPRPAYTMPEVVVNVPRCEGGICPDDGGSGSAGRPGAGDAGPHSGGSGGGIRPPTPRDTAGACNPNTNPDCFQPLSTWDKETIRVAFARHQNKTFTDARAAQACNALAAEFNRMLANGSVGRGAFGSTGEPDDPKHVAAYDRIGRTIHFEPAALDAANAGNPDAVRNIFNSALHEAAHSLDYQHSPPLWAGGYDLYQEFPFNLLSPGVNSCITNW